MSTTANSHLDDNVAFTQTSATTWEVTTADGSLVGRVEKSHAVFEAFNAAEDPVGVYETAESAMFALVIRAGS
jgi:hypothetical protein